MARPLSPADLTTHALARRLAELTGEERSVQVEFLLHLGELDRRRAYLDAGYDSLWTYCLRALHLREGPAGRRIGAMRVLRRVPALAPALRDGRLCLSTITVLGPLLTEGNAGELVARAAYRTKAEVEQLAAALHPRIAPAEGVRKLARRLPESGSAPAGALAAAAPAPAPPTPTPTPTGTPIAIATAAPRLVAPSPAAPPSPSRSELRPVSADEWSLRVTLDAAMKADLESLRDLLGHEAGGDLRRGHAGVRGAGWAGVSGARPGRGSALAPRARPSHLVD